ncbi:midcut-by-XrtH protein [Kineobactrum salinum]|uniref:Midcut-by-XrtH protein n=1 Tax=Kineobactrum salinum TaxID=2708301 RepID=A0A6C0U6X8_9GAMM|nr:midcut-by-XrtH protein [Kineobactrum salinum]QIB66185.1 midcut-by-XrtH protein [Kineobactrum salinum]
MASSRLMGRGIGAFLLALAAPVFSQSITTSAVAPGSAIPVPVTNPVVLALMTVLVLALALRMLRRVGLQRTLLSLLVVGTVVGATWQSPALRAQLLAAFTNPDGETLPIPVTQIPAGPDVAGFEMADFSNASGVPLVITSLDPPVFEDCFPGGLSGELLPAGGGGGASPDACTGVLADGANCRVNVDSICRAEAENSLAILSLTGSPLTLTVNGAAGAMTVTNTSTQVTATGIASSFAGTALAGNVTESGNTCAAVPPGGSCTLTFTPGNTVVPVTDLVISGDDTNTVTAAIEVQSGSTLTEINPVQGAASGGTGVILKGTGLTGATGITFDGVAATSVNVVNSTTVTAVTPAQVAGAVDVAIATPAGSATLVNGYTYLATAVGQSASGGTIAALNGGLQNLVAAAADNSPAIEWGGLGTATIVAQSDTDGAGNTAAIVADLGPNGGTPYAAQLCNDFEVDSQGNTPCQAGNACYNDWFLPARGQLDALFDNRVAVGGYASTAYWSSTESSGDPVMSAWIRLFDSGLTFVVNKDFLSRARCVRAFTP